MRKILDVMFRNKRLSRIIPLICTTIVYLLFVIGGKTSDKNEMIIITPIASVIWFFGMFLMVYLQVKNASCPEWFLNLIELSATVLFGIYAVIGVIFFFASGLQIFNPSLCLGMVTYSAVSLAHSKRSK